MESFESCGGKKREGAERKEKIAQKDFHPVKKGSHRLEETVSVV